jgi:hypothetical protein
MPSTHLLRFIRIMLVFFLSLALLWIFASSIWPGVATGLAERAVGPAGDDAGTPVPTPEYAHVQVPVDGGDGTNATSDLGVKEYDAVNQTQNNSSEDSKETV